MGRPDAEPYYEAIYQIAAAEGTGREPPFRIVVPHHTGEGDRP